MSTTALYDAFSEDYDRFVDWEARLAYELPFIRTLLQHTGARRVLDLACGTGQHAIALAREGYAVTAADLSEGMVARAEENARRAGVSLSVHRLGFGELGAASNVAFDAVLSLGNSLPHVLDQDTLRHTLADIRKMLQPGGLVLVQMRNFDRVLSERQRYMPPESHRDEGKEWLFYRFYDWEKPLLRFNVVRLQRSVYQSWRAEVHHTYLHPWRSAELLAAFQDAGLSQAEAYGNLAGAPFDAQTSPDFVLAARRV